MTILFRVKSFDLKQPGMRKVKKIQNSSLILRAIEVVKLVFADCSIVNSQLILDELGSFYQNLYRNQDYQDIDDIYANFFNITTLPKVMEDTKLLCEGVLSTQEWLQCSANVF